LNGVDQKAEVMKAKLKEWFCYPRTIQKFCPTCYDQFLYEFAMELFVTSHEQGWKEPTSEVVVPQERQRKMKKGLKGKKKEAAPQPLAPAPLAPIPQMGGAPVPIPNALAPVPNGGMVAPLPGPPMAPPLNGNSGGAAPIPVPPATPLKDSKTKPVITDDKTVRVASTQGKPTNAFLPGFATGVVFTAVGMTMLYACVRGRRKVDDQLYVELSNDV